MIPPYQRRWRLIYRRRWPVRSIMAALVILAAVAAGWTIGRYAA